jgi:biotin-(acetyl-CoA carboxylase) ligase
VGTAHHWGLDIFSIQDKRVPIAVGIIIGVGVGIGIDPDPDSDPDTDAQRLQEKTAYLNACKKSNMCQQAVRQINALRRQYDLIGASARLLLLKAVHARSNESARYRCHS